MKLSKEFTLTKQTNEKKKEKQYNKKEKKIHES